MSPCRSRRATRCTAWNRIRPRISASSLGTIAARGEVGALIVSLDSLLRMSSNPFFPYLLGRIEEGIGPAPQTAAAPR